MELSEKQLKKLKTKLALDGVGSKRKLSTELGCEPSQLSYILKTGFVSKSLDEKILNYINK
jgi:transcriptional regulator CtsR